MRFVARLFPIARVRHLVVVTFFFASVGTPSLNAQDKSVAEIGDSSQRVALSAGQARAIQVLNESRPEKPAALFVFTDPNKDPDDLSVLIETKYLQQRGFVDLRCIVTTLGDREVRLTRARFARSVLDQLEMDKVAVGAGVDYGFDVQDAQGRLDVEATRGREKDHRVFVETPLLRPRAVVDLDGLSMLKKELSRVEDRSAVLVANAGMADLAALLRDDPDLVQQKTAKVVIMGGVEPKLDQRGFVVADKRAYNNSTHQPSANETYLRVQELGLPLVVVNKEATYSAAAPRSFYDGIAATRHPVGIYLQSQQKASLKHLWEGIQQGHLPPALTPKWFFNTFTDVDLGSAEGKAAFDHSVAHADDFEGIWNQVSKFNLYDPLALLAATPGASELLFRGDVPEGVLSNVLVIGKNSIKDSELIKDLLAAIGIESLQPTVP